MKDGVKIFGLRSAKAYKMIPALLYYAAMAYFIGASIVGELLHYKFETIDYILMFEKYLFFAILFFSPLIFLSDFKCREKLPFFKKHTFGSSLSGMIIVWMFCYFMAQVCIMNMSDTWVQSRDVYTKQRYKKVRRPRKGQKQNVRNSKKARKNAAFKENKEKQVDTGNRNGSSDIGISKRKIKGKDY